MTIRYFSDNRNGKLAYVHLPATKAGGALPAVMFLGGFKSDMAGTKAVYLEDQCRLRGQEFVRFDYSGHGVSDGDFVDGTIGSWLADAMDILDHIVARDVILVGSSMGGWISLRLLQERESRIKGFVGIAAAPDFTKRVKSEMSVADHDMIALLGRLEVPNDYSDEPYIFTRSLLEDGDAQSILGQHHKVAVPMVLIQGKEDEDVPWQTAERINSAYPRAKIDIIYVEDGDHRLSRDQDLTLINDHVMRLSSLA